MKKVFIFDNAGQTNRRIRSGMRSAAKRGVPATVSQGAGM
jgi:hypothetical protein